MEVGGRSKSVPSGDRNVVNPFWSQKARDEHVLQASRPSGLPPDDVSIEFTLQNSMEMDGNVSKLSDMLTGKGRGCQTVQCQ